MPASQFGNVLVTTILITMIITITITDIVMPYVKDGREINKIYFHEHEKLGNVLFDISHLLTIKFIYNGTLQKKGSSSIFPRAFVNTSFVIFFSSVFHK